MLCVLRVIGSCCMRVVHTLRTLCVHVVCMLYSCCVHVVFVVYMSEYCVHVCCMHVVSVVCAWCICCLDGVCCVHGSCCVGVFLQQARRLGRVESVRRELMRHHQFYIIKRRQTFTGGRGRVG